MTASTLVEPNTTTVHHLSNAQRDDLLETINRDGFAIMPFEMPQDMLDGAITYLDKMCEQEIVEDPDRVSFSRNNIVEEDEVFRKFLSYKPAMQLCYDKFGPMFHLGQDVIRAQFPEPEGQNTTRIRWHSDGPIEFPQNPDGTMACHTLRFGYFLSDCLHEDSGTLEVIRGSHRKPVLHHHEGLVWNSCWDLNVKHIEENDMEQNRVTVKAKAGTIVVFHNAIWHMAKANRSAIDRKICYFQYCPTFMHPHHRDLPYPGDMSHLNNEEKWLMHEPRRPKSWMVGTPDNHQRMARFKRDEN